MTNTITFEYWPVDANTPKKGFISMYWPKRGWALGHWETCPQKKPAYWFSYDTGRGAQWHRENPPTHWTHAIPAPGGDNAD